MKYIVYTTDAFDNAFDRLDSSEKKKVSKIVHDLETKGDSVGKPLGRKYFREKKFRGKRVYFLFCKNFAIVLLVGISNKKMQQKTIEEILCKIKEYEEYIRGILKR